MGIKNLFYVLVNSVLQLLEYSVEADIIVPNT